MLIYRFRITASDHDDFLREVEIQPNHTFLEFHHLLVETAELRNLSGASFFMTDKANKVKHEITLKNTKKQVRKYDDDIGEVVLESVVLPLMKDAKIKNYIEDPHQTMNYVFHGKEIIIMHIELFKILQSDNLISYPRVARKTGEIRKIVELPPPLLAPEAEAIHPEIKPLKIKPVAAAKLPDTSKLDVIVEDMDEIKAIEEELSELIEEEAPQVLVESQVSTGDDGEDPEYGDDEKMEHIEDFADPDQLYERYSNYREGPDDY